MAKKQYQLVTCTINGREVEQMVDVRASLTDMLRNDFHLTSVKKGCEVGECGACNVLIDGEVLQLLPVSRRLAEGKHVTTLEGLMGPNGELSDIQQAFIDETASSAASARRAWSWRQRRCCCTMQYRTSLPSMTG